MPTFNPLQARSRALRLVTGLVLFAYVATHLANHAVGLVSLAAAEAVRAGFVALWRNPLATAALYGSLLLHVGLALAALYERRTLRMPALELARIALGFAIPVLLATHMVQTRLAHELTGLDDSYARIASGIWAGGSTPSQLALMVVVWLHGCFGLHLVLRHRARWRHWQPALLVAATLLPALAFGGFLVMAREAPPPDRALLGALDAHRATLERAITLVATTPLALLAATLAARALQVARARRRGDLVRISYPSRTVDLPAGGSVLEASRMHGIPHGSLCGGRARCSTCRVKVLASAAPLPPPGPDEARTLARVGAPPDVRLACQLRPAGALSVRPLLAPREAVLALEAESGAHEREVVVLFTDLRRWTTLSEQQLPFDLAYVLDHYFEAVGDAVREAGGVPNQFIGDSVMALFGLEGSPAEAARQALAAADGIARRMAALNDTLAHEFKRPLEAGIGIHAGLAAVGTVGYRETRTLSAVGDAVNTASRLQELTKALQVPLVASAEVLEQAGADLAGWQRHELPIRGREGTMVVYARGFSRPAPPPSPAPRTGPAPRSRPTA